MKPTPKAQAPQPKAAKTKTPAATAKKTAAEIEKERQQVAELERAVDIFGGLEDDFTPGEFIPQTEAPQKNTFDFDTFKPKTDAEVDKFFQTVLGKLLEQDGNPYYPTMIKNFVAATVKELDPEEMKDVGKAINIWVNEAVKKKKVAPKTTAVKKPAIKDRQGPSANDDYGFIF
eukprot:TRINITY_DN18316_c0_g1_i1.p1 TRINITY_DN18316_c0_g1~~TRINITY_DN18316_c0_g1_i1.p1  ORF type:complete len:174 (-),score=37.96 TRINITY_DN18316_c0_g1_i1:58-579(-)